MAKTKNLFVFFLLNKVKTYSNLKLCSIVRKIEPIGVGVLAMKAQIYIYGHMGRSLYSLPMFFCLALFIFYVKYLKKHKIPSTVHCFTDTWQRLLRLFSSLYAFPPFLYAFLLQKYSSTTKPNHSQPVNTGSPSFQMTKKPSDRSDEEFVVNLHAAG